MGCASSTEVVSNPYTGEQKTKHKLGGSYPGNRRNPQSENIIPTEFNSNGQATTHFISYGGGNALVPQGNHGQPQMGGNSSSNNNYKKPEYIKVTLPNGVKPGQLIHVRAPDGRLNEVIVPDGFGPGSTFTVEFASDPNSNIIISTKETTVTPLYNNTTTPSTTLFTNNNNDPNYDDGFASGFNNPNFVPTTTNTTNNIGGGNYYNDNDPIVFASAIPYPNNHNTTSVPISSSSSTYPPPPSYPSATARPY